MRMKKTQRAGEIGGRNFNGFKGGFKFLRLVSTGQTARARARPAGRTGGGGVQKEDEGGRERSLCEMPRSGTSSRFKVISLNARGSAARERRTLPLFKRIAFSCAETLAGTSDGGGGSGETRRGIDRDDDDDGSRRGRERRHLACESCATH